MSSSRNGWGDLWRESIEMVLFSFALYQYVYRCIILYPRLTVDVRCKTAGVRGQLYGSVDVRGTEDGDGIGVDG